MNQKIKQLLMTIVGLLLSTSAFAHDFEVDGIYYNYLDNTAKTVEVTYEGNSYNSYSNEYTGSVTIPSSVTYSGTTYSVTSIGNSAFSGCSGLTEVTIPNSVTSIGDWAFVNCTGLTELIIEDGKETLSLGCNSYHSASLGEGLFYDCPLKKIYLGRNLSYGAGRSYGYSPFYNSKLEEITISNSVTSIGDYAFSGCSGLTYITIPNSVTSIGNTAFSGCSGLTEVTIPNSVTSIGNSAFSGCSGLTEVTIPNSVTSIGDRAFYYCDGLTSVTIGNSVTSIGNSAFYDCTSLELVVNCSNLIFSKGSSSYGYIAYYVTNVINVKNDPNASIVEDFVFYKTDNENRLAAYLGNAIEVFLPTDFNGGNYVIGDYAFYGCTSLSTITIPNSATSIGDYAFSGCTGLTSVTIPNSVTSIGDYAFYGCSNIYSLTIGSGISSISSNTFSVKPKKTIWLTNTPPSGSSYASGRVNYVANEQYSSLSNVVVYPYLSSMFEVDGVKYVPVSPSERTCDAIDCSYNSTDSIINIGNTVSFKGVAMSVKDIKSYTCYGNDYIKTCTINYNGNIGGYAFYSCDSIEYLNLSVNDIKGYAFQNSATVNLATFSIDAKSINDYAFNGCTAIEKAIINAKSIANSAFKGCSAIEKATIKSETIGEYAFQNSATINPATFYVDAKSIAESTFDGCSEIETITLGTELETIGNSAFNSCSKLNEVIIPNSVTYLGTYAFYGCSSLTSATIGNAVENINSSTFYNCKSLENIIIGNTVKSIGNNTFYGCSSLPSIEIPKNVTSIGNYAFDNCSKLSNVIIEDRDTVLTLGSNGSSPMFSDCPLDSVYIGGDISYKTTSSYGYSPFYNNKTLRAVTITDKETEISDNEFYGCANLKSVSIGDGVETIGKYAFSGCASLESFAFGSSMKTIGKEAFSDCTALIKLSSKATTPPACGTQALDDINKWNCELIVPDDAISAYQTADQWKEFFFISPNKIDEITTNVNDAIEIARYDIHGRLLSEPTKGINIIKYSDGSTRKEIVKE